MRGEHNRDVLTDWLGLDDDQVDELELASTLIADELPDEPSARPTNRSGCLRTLPDRSVGRQRGACGARLGLDDGDVA